MVAAGLLALVLAVPAPAGTPVSPETLRLYRAITLRDGSAQAIRDAIAAGASANAERGGSTPLSEAINFGNVEAIEALLAAGADPNLCPARMTFCPLVTAIICSTKGYDDAKREKIVSMLLKAGASPNGSPGNRHKPLTQAATHRLPRITEMLLKAGAKADIQAPSWEVPLLVAARHGDAKTIASLLASGQKPDEPTERGLTALWLATAFDCAECVKVLLKAGARYELEVRPSSSSSASWFDIIGGTGAETFKAYVERGLDAKHVGSGKRTFLHVAAEHDRGETIKLLASRGVAVDARDERSFTPLMIAALYGRAGAAKALVEAKANVTLINDWGKTAKAIAEEKSFYEIVTILSGAGAREYAGTRLPSSAYDPELAGKEQTDVTAGFQSELPFLDPAIRFFAAHAPFPPRRYEPDLRTEKATVYAVKPGPEVVKLEALGDFTKLRFTIRKKEDALRLARVFSDPGLAVRHGNLVVGFDGLDLMELPKPNGCLSVTLEPLRKAGVGEASVAAADSGFVVTRYLVPRQGFPLRLALDSVTRVKETIRPDGTYVATREKVSTPGLSIQATCFPR